MVLPTILEHRLLHYSWVFIIVFTCKTPEAAVKSVLNEGKRTEVNDGVLGLIFIVYPPSSHLFIVYPPSSHRYKAPEGGKQPSSERGFGLWKSSTSTVLEQEQMLHSSLFKDVSTLTSFWARILFLAPPCLLVCLARGIIMNLLMHYTTHKGQSSQAYQTEV